MATGDEKGCTVVLSREEKLRRTIIDGLSSSDTSGGWGLAVRELLEIVIAYSLGTARVLTIDSRAGDHPDSTDGRSFLDCVPFTLSNGDPTLLVTDSDRDVVRSVHLITREWRVFAGVDGGRRRLIFGDEIGAPFESPIGVGVFPNGGVLISDGSNSTIHSIRNGVVSSLVGSRSSGFPGADGVGSNASFAGPSGMTLTSDGAVVYVCDSHKIRRIAMSDRRVTTVAGNGVAGHVDGPSVVSSIFSADSCVFDRYTPVPDSVLYISSRNRIRILNLQTRHLSTLTISTGQAINPSGIAFINPHLLAVVCRRTSSVYAIDIRNGVATWLAGVQHSDKARPTPLTADGKREEASAETAADTVWFERPFGCCVVATAPNEPCDADGYVFVVDVDRVHRIDIPLAIPVTAPAR